MLLFKASRFFQMSQKNKTMPSKVCKMLGHPQNSQGLQHTTFNAQISLENHNNEAFTLSIAELKSYITAGELAIDLHQPKTAMALVNEVICYLLENYPQPFMPADIKELLARSLRAKVSILKQGPVDKHVQINKYLEQALRLTQTTEETTAAKLITAQTVTGYQVPTTTPKKRLKPR